MPPNRRPNFSDVDGLDQGFRLVVLRDPTRVLYLGLVCSGPFFLCVCVCVCSPLSLSGCCPSFVLCISAVAKYNTRTWCFFCLGRRTHSRSLALGPGSFAHWGSWSLTDRVAELKPKVHAFAFRWEPRMMPRHGCTCVCGRVCPRGGVV